ncbi:hypothetical protein EGW08_009220, partial [Elysia chlorotica]
MERSAWMCLGLLVWVSSCCLAAEFDPCPSVNHMVLSNVKRSAGYQTQASDRPLCDTQLVQGWYRFQSGAGGEMPNTCPDRLRCGTVAPVWMNGKVPSATDGITTARACANFNDTSGPRCCQRSIDILVKNCTGFLVYYLKPTPTCSIAYCAGDRAPCPAG